MGRAKDRLGRVGNKLRTLPDEGVQSGNRRIRASVLASLREDAGPDRRPSGVRNGRPQTVTTTKRKNGNLVEGRVMAGPRSQRAPWFWMNEGTKAGRRGSKVGRYNSRRANRGWHPGTPAKQTWSRGVRAVMPEVRADMERLYRKAINS